MRASVAGMIGGVMLVSIGGCRSERRDPRDFAPDSLWISNVQTVSPRTGVIERDRALLLAGGRIRASVSTKEVNVRGRVRVVDGQGAYAIPGLWDAHVHLLQQGDEATDQQARQALAHGVTHVRDMGSSLDARQRYVQRMNAPGVAAPSLWGAGPTLWAFDSPYGNPQQQVVATDSVAVETVVDSLVRAGVDFIKVYAGFDRTRLPWLTSAAKRRGKTVAGHAQPGMTLAEQARLGVVTIEHLDFSTFAECNAGADDYFDRVIASRFRNTGESIPAIYAAFAAAVDTPACRASLRRAADAGLVLTPTLVASFLSAADAGAMRARLPARQQEECALYLRQFDTLSAAQQAMLPAAGARLLRVVVDAGLPLLAGTDAPAFCARIGESLARELQLLAEAGVSPLAVLQSATSTPARLFGSGGPYGDLAVGQAADLVLLGTNPLTDPRAYQDVRGVFAKDRWYDANALAALRSP